MSTIGFGPFTSTPAQPVQVNPKVQAALSLLNVLEQISMLRQQVAHDVWNNVDLTKVDNFQIIVNAGNEINHEHDVQQQIVALRNRVNNWNLNAPWSPNAAFPKPSDNLDDVLTKYIEDLGLKYV